MSRRLIISADDFGLSARINDGIIEAHRKGVVASASLLATMPGFDDAVQKAKANPALDIGVHLNAFRGKPLTPLPFLASRGTFSKSLPRTALRILRSPSRATRELMQEFRAQIEKVRGAGISITHLDTEKHLHVLPPVMEVVCALAQEYHLAARMPFEPRGAAGSVGQRIKIALARPFEKRTRAVLARAGVPAPRCCIGPALSGNFTLNSLERSLAALPDGMSELSTHPGYADAADDSYLKGERERERAVLEDPALRAILERNGVSLATFNDLKKG